MQAERTAHPTPLRQEGAFEVEQHKTQRGKEHLMRWTRKPVAIERTFQQMKCLNQGAEIILSDC